MLLKIHLSVILSTLLAIAYGTAPPPKILLQLTHATAHSPHRFFEMDFGKLCYVYAQTNGAPHDKGTMTTGVITTDGVTEDLPTFFADKIYSRLFDFETGLIAHLNGKDSKDLLDELAASVGYIIFESLRA